MKKKMFLGADKNIFENARLLRENQTNAEIILWSFLRQKPLGYKFRRQHPLGIYIADFYCHSLKLIIELDGSIHARTDIKIRDDQRQKNLESEGFSFLRFSNSAVEKNFEVTCKTIEVYLRNQLSRT